MKPREYMPEPRIWNAGQVATRLGRCLNWFYQNRKTLETYKFPKQIELLGGWDSKLIERWLDEKAGILNLLPDKKAAELMALEATRNYGEHNVSQGH